MSSPLPASGKRRQVDAHWQRDMSYLKLGWNWVRLAITHQWKIQVSQFLPSLPDPQPALASKRQREDAFRRESTILSRIPASYTKLWKAVLFDQIKELESNQSQLSLERS